MADLVTKVEVFLSAKGLQKLDTFSNSDPFAVLYAKHSNGQIVELGRTETIWDTQTPKWTKQFLLDFHFESIQKLEIKLYDRDSPEEQRLEKHDFLGSAETTLGALMGSRGQALDLKLSDPAKATKDIEAERQVQRMNHLGSVFTKVKSSKIISIRTGRKLRFRCRNFVMEILIGLCCWRCGTGI